MLFKYSDSVIFVFDFRSWLIEIFFRLFIEAGSVFDFFLIVETRLPWEELLLKGFLVVGEVGFSFSWKRLFGLSGLRSSIAQKTGIPTTRGGAERKIGRWFLNLLFGRR
jgi:hypothetical protein